MNRLKTALLLAAMTALFMTIGQLIGGAHGMALALVFAVVSNAVAYWFSDKIVLRMHGAREVGPQDAPEFYAMVRELAERAQLPMPKVYIMETAQPNAFATGRNPENAAVAATTGLLRMLEPREIRGVMAHELAHIKNRDTLIMTVTATLAGAIASLVNFALFFRGNSQQSGPMGGPMGIVATLAMMVLAPLAATLVQMAISRTREYAADRVGAEIAGDPHALASALQKIEQGALRIDNHEAERNPATAHMFIINPLHAHAVDNLFSTHPKTANRVRALLEYAAAAGGVGYNSARAEISANATMGAERNRVSGGAIPSTRHSQKPGPWG